jgi:hypothetical protein
MAKGYRNSRPLSMRVTKTPPEYGGDGQFGLPWQEVRMFTTALVPP